MKIHSKQKTVTLLILAWVALAACFTKVGTTAAPFLKIEYGARPVAMGGAFVAIADDPSGIYYNPAGLAELKSPQFMGGYTVLFADLKYNYATFILPTKRVNLGLWGSFLYCDDIPVTTVENPEGTGQRFSYIDGLLGFTVSAFLSDRLSVGVSCKYIQQKLHNESASTFAFDIGSILRTPFRGIRLGMCLANYGGRMQLDGNDLIVQADPWPEYTGNPEVEARLSTGSFPLPLAFKLGIAIELLGLGEAFFPSEQHRVILAVDGIHPNDGEEKVQLGLEYGLYDMLFLRGGYKFNYDTQTYAAGAGMKFTIGQRTFSVDYAYIDMDVLDGTHRISLTIGF
ncbi:MAG: PorV/PorQ family protein [candidate division WOR-3 bacterium]|nr:MAG: PorV/PorQ family protein [candidate division WOR-3 bacterium]